MFSESTIQIYDNKSKTYILKKNMKTNNSMFNLI